MAMGCGFINVVDGHNRVFSWGDNYGSQLGTKDDIHREDPFLIKALSEQIVTQVSLGFQHALYLTEDGQVFAVGKNNRFQLGKDYNVNFENEEIFDKYQTVKMLDYWDEPVAQVHAGKFHSLFLTESGKLYGLGYNKYG